MAKTAKTPDCRCGQGSYFCHMKRELLNPKLMLATAVAATLLTGCASADRGYTGMNGPTSALAFTTVTVPNQAVKWTGDRFLQMALRSIDTYTFQVPDTGYNPGAAPVGAGAPGVYTTGTGTVDVNGTETSMGAPYQTATGTGGYKTIIYRPGHSR